MKNKKYSVLIVSCLLSFRMLGLFMLLPVFSVFSSEYSNSNSILTGMALGIYGFSQAIFTIPFGLLSDKYGRKNLIILGFSLFAIGSFIGFISESIYGIIISRFFQGSGAVGSVLLAFASDISSDQNRTRNMAILGISIGASFLISIILGPIIAYNFGISKIFLFSFLSSIASLYICHFYINPQKKEIPFISIKRNIKHLFSKSLRMLYAGIFIIHASLTSIFLLIPNLLIQTNDFFLQSFIFYFPVLLLSVSLSLPLVLLLEKRMNKKTIILFSMLLFLFSNIYMLLFHYSYTHLLFCMLLFFTSFNLLESILPSLVSKLSHVNMKGVTLGIFSCCQFMGIFCGGFIGGIVNHVFGFYQVMFFCISMILLWFLINIHNIKQINF